MLWYMSVLLSPRRGAPHPALGGRGHAVIMLAAYLIKPIVVTLSIRHADRGINPRWFLDGFWPQSTAVSLGQAVYHCGTIFVG